MSVAKVSAVRTGQSERSRLWTEQALAEQAELEARAAKPMNDKIAAATREAAKTAGKLLQAEMQAELQRVRYELTTAPSPEFQTQDYDGRFKSAAEVTAGIDAAYAAFKARTDDGDVKLTYDFLQAGNWQKADTSRIEVWESAYQFCLRKLKAVEDKYAAPAPEPVVEPVLSKMDQRRADLTAKRDEQRPGSDAYNKADHDLMVFETQEEVILKDGIHDILAEIIDQSGKVLSASHNLAYRNWLASPLQSRRYTDSKEDIRLSFAEYFGCPEILSQVELDEVSRRKRVGSLTSDQVKAIVGDNTHSMGYDPGRRI
jgi:hypothetical protein